MARNAYAAFYLRNFCQCLIFWRTRTSTVPVRFLFVRFFHEKCVSFELSFFLKWWCFKRCLLWRYQPAWMNAKTQQSSNDDLSSKFKGTAVSEIENMSPRSILFYSGPADTCSLWLVEFAGPLWVLSFSSSVQQLSLHQMYQKNLHLIYLSSDYLVDDTNKWKLLLRGEAI